LREPPCYIAKTIDNMASLKNIPLLSEVEQLVLLAVLKLDTEGDAYAVPIRALIRKEAGVDLPRGSIYVTLSRLEDKGLVRSWMTEPIAVQGGKARRVFGVSAAGKTALRTVTRAMTRMMAGTELARG
jgi:PadR family transcriptional regulator, regulatory protein PadR